MRASLIRRAAAFTRDKLVGEPKEKRIAHAKRQYELQLRAAGLTVSQAKKAVSVRFNGAAQEG